jgi:hypothetical protein
MRPFLIGAACVALIGCSCPLPSRGVVQPCTSQGCFLRTAATTPIEPKRAPVSPEPAMKPKKVAIGSKTAAARPPNEAGHMEEKANSRPSIESEVRPPAQSSAIPDPAPKSATTTIGGKTAGPALGEPSETSELVPNKTTTAIGSKTEGPATGQPSETSEAVRNKTTTAIGSKTEGPATGQPSETADPVLKKAKITVAAKMETPASAEFVDAKRAVRENIFGQPFEVICGHVKGKRKSGEATGERPFLYFVKEDEAFIVGSNPDSVAAIAYRAHCTSPNSQR